jgi:hypothetical protein
MDGEATLKGDGVIEQDYTSGGGGREKGVNFSSVRGRGRSRGKNGDTRLQQQQQNVDLEAGIVDDKNKKRSSFVQLPFAVAGLEQSMPADAVLAKEGAEEVSSSLLLYSQVGGTEFGPVLAGYRSCCYAIGYHHTRRCSGRYFVYSSLYN